MHPNFLNRSVASPRCAGTILGAVAALLLAGCAQLPPPPATASPDQRVSNLKSDPPGIVIFRGWGAPAAEPAAAAALTAPATAPATAAAPTSTPAAAAPASAAPAATPFRLSNLWRALPPPSGKPVQDLKQLNEPGLGIAVPTAASRASEARR